VAAALVIGALMMCARAQTSYWRNSETLWRHTLAVTTRNAVAHTNLGNVLSAYDALPHYEAALAIDPDSSLPLNKLARILATAPDDSLRNGARAVTLAERANRIIGARDPIYLRTLAVAYAEAGRFDDAIQTAERALPLAEAEGNAALAFDLRNNIAGYRLREPMRDRSLGP
jgi:tetratricopeptide (TPR) repeat protein